MFLKLRQTSQTHSPTINMDNLEGAVAKKRKTLHAEYFSGNGITIEDS
jgi:hypothetical protein